MKNLHEGHRERMRKKFLKTAIEAFTEHEVLEMLLFYAVPRVNTNEIAHELLNRFGSLGSVLNAPVEALTETKHLSENGATLLKLIPQILKLYPREPKTACMDNYDELKSYFKNEFLGARNEQFKVVCLTQTFNVISCELICEGDVNVVKPEPLKIVETALKHNSRIVIISHNHPTALSLPSDDDITTTRMFKRVLEPLGITLLDHVIVSGFGDVTSMRQSGYMSILDK